MVKIAAALQELESLRVGKKASPLLASTIGHISEAFIESAQDTASFLHPKHVEKLLLLFQPVGCTVFARLHEF